MTTSIAIANPAVNSARLSATNPDSERSASAPVPPSVETAAVPSNSAVAA
jgi:hypothetical protein